jgi:hypothetical protein
MECAGGRTRPVPIAVLRLFPSAFEDGSAPRPGNSQRDLGKGLVIAFVSVLCGATSCAGMAAFGQAKESVFRNFLKLWHAVPSQDTRLALCRRIGPKALDAAFGRFLADVAAPVQGGDLIAIGGTALFVARQNATLGLRLRFICRRRGPGLWVVEGPLHIQGRATGKASVGLRGPGFCRTVTVGNRPGRNHCADLPRLGAGQVAKAACLRARCRTGGGRCAGVDWGKPGRGPGTSHDFQAVTP